MNETPSGILTLDGAGDDLHLPPGQTPITSAKRIARIRKQPATVGFVDDEVARLARAMLQQYGPLALNLREVMLRLMALEDFCLGEIDADEMKARIVASTRPPAPAAEEPAA